MANKMLKLRGLDVMRLWKDALFIRYILDHTDVHLVNLDKLTYVSNLESLADVCEHPQYSFVQGDIADQRLVKGLLHRYRPKWWLTLQRSRTLAV